MYFIFQESLFVMAGKEQLLDPTGATSTSNVIIPTVMLTFHDSRSLLSDLLRLDALKLAPKVRLHIQKTPLMTDDAIFGLNDYPKAFVSQSMVTVQTSGSWAVKIWKIVDENEVSKWQIMLLNKAVLSLPHAPVAAITSYGQGITTTRYGSYESVAMYQLLVNEQCSISLNFNETANGFSLVRI